MYRRRLPRSMAVTKSEALFTIAEVSWRQKIGTLLIQRYESGS